MAGSDPAVEAGVAAGQQASALGRNKIQASTAVAQGYDAAFPGIEVPASQPLGAGAVAALVANRVHLARFVAPKSQPITKVAFGVGVAATFDDPIDIGIYTSDQAPYTLLGRTGPTTGLLLATGRRQASLLAPVNLIGGVVYYAAFAHGPIGGTAASICVCTIRPEIQVLFSPAPAAIEIGFNNAGYPLPSTLSFGGGITSVPVVALIQ